MDPPIPPGYAWDWFTRQRLLWREAQDRLRRRPGNAGTAYDGLDTRAEVTARLREDYPIDAGVRDVVDAVVREVAFLDRTDKPFGRVAAASAPRGLRWWWSRLSDDDAPPAPPRPPARDRVPDTQLTIEDVLSGYGDDRSGTSNRNRLPGSSAS
jgi:hypothetical protein